MLKKVLLGAFLLLVVISIGLFLWARAVFAEDGVRMALAAQLSKALGQPVKVGSIAATIYPRLTVNLGGVAIGEPARIHAQTFHVGTDFRALLSRRIEHARIELTGARIELPLPAFSIAGASSSASSGKPPVELVSIDAIVLRGVEIVSAGRTLRGDVELVPEGSGLQLRKVTLLADNAAINVTGRITDLAGPVGDIAIRADALNFDRLLAFANDFSSGASVRSTAKPSSPPARAANPNAGRPVRHGMNVVVSLQAERATMGGLALDKLTGTARITDDAMTLEPIEFGVFRGRYTGALAFTLGDVPDVRLHATLSDVDAAAAAAFAGSPGAITGRMSAKLDVTSRGMDAPSVTKAAHGTARADIVDGVIKNLGLVRGAIVATSGRADAMAAGLGTRDEPFTNLGVTLTIANGSASTQDLRFQSKDILLNAAGSVRLDASAINLQGDLQLSDELSRQAGRDLVRYTQDSGRVTLPVNISGPVDAPQVRIDVGSLAKRAITNRANEEGAKLLKKGLGSLFKK